MLTNPKGQERILSLAYVSAPRLRREGDEAFAFQSREYLRELLVGKVIQFETLYAIPTTKREYGRLRIPNGPEFPDQSVSEGWVKVREDAGRKEESEEAAAYLEKITGLESQAKGASKGVWTSSGDGINTVYDLPDPNALVAENKDKKIDVVIEKVLTGDRLIVRLLLSPKNHVQTMLVVGGIRAPSTKRTTPDGKETPAEPYGTEAQQFVEERLLQRKCVVQLLGVTPQNQLIGAVLHPRGNIASFLLEAGLARCHDAHVTLLGSEMGQLRQSEKAAKDARKGIFTGATASKAKGADHDYIVSRVFNADTVFIRTRAGVEKRISLSSIRQPKPSDPKQSPFAADAKEFLRKKLIGKHVKVSVDGKKPASEGYEEREVATITLNEKNVALQVIEAGYASVIRHRKDDDDRSPDYDALLLAEEAAQKDGKGMWSSKHPAAKQYQDYSENVTKAKMEVTVLQRQKKIPAVVDFVKSGSRFTLLVPRENAKLTFVLSGIRAPRSARKPGDAADPFGQEAHNFANRRCLQRDVEIDVETMDKVGGFIGTLYVGRENFAKSLVEEGLAEVHAYSAEQSGHSNELFAAEKKAKESRKGLWHDWDPSKDAEEEVHEANGTNGTAEADSITRRKDYRDVIVTHVGDDGKLKLQQVGPGTAALSELMNAFKSFHINKANEQPLPGPPKAGDFVAAKFTADNDWYRAKVRRVDRDAKKVEVVYIDYGNSETLPWSRLRPLTQAQFSNQKLKGQAVDGALSFLQLPSSANYLKDAVAFIGELTEGRELVANVDYISTEGTLTVTLMYPDAPTIDESINAQVIEEGLAMVPKKLKAWERAAGDTLVSLKKIETQAKQGRRGMWEYGDLTED